jgi:hypothetical protein
MKKHTPVIALAIFVIAWVFGFFIGRKTISEIEKTVYVKGETITDTVEIPYPVREEIPVYVQFPARHDTLYIDNIVYITETVDTLAIIADYIIKRSYDVPLFDNQNGKADVSLDVQYNKLAGLSYTFTPIREVQYISVKKVFQPYISASYSTFGVVGIGGGFFRNNFGVEYQYLRDLQNRYGDSQTGHQFGVKWKF